MDQVGKLDRVLDEEHRDIVADEIEVAFVGVELDREAAHVARQVARARAARHRREAHEHLGFLARVLQECGLGQFAKRFGRLEVAMRAGAARMHDALRDALVIEMRDLFAQDEVFKQGRPARAALQRILVIRDRNALIGGQHFAGLRGRLMRFAAVSRP